MSTAEGRRAGTPRVRESGAGRRLAKHPGGQQREGCCREQSSGSSGQRGLFALGRFRGTGECGFKIHVLLRRLFGHSESSDYFRRDLVVKWLNELEQGEYFMQKVLLVVE